MKRLFAYIALFVAMVLYAISCSNNWTEEFTDARYEGPLPFSYDKFRYGDLFGISFLPEYKFELAKEPSYVKKQKFDIPPEITLYMTHDSYVGFHLGTDTNFYGISKIIHKEWFKGEPIQAVLDTSRINVLMFEVSERFFRYISDSITLKKEVEVYKDSSQLKQNIKPMIEKEPGFLQSTWDYIFNPQTNENLEFNAFDYHFITPLRELKAQLNYKLFGRISKEVVVSNHNDHLYYAETIDTAQKSSSFNTLTDDEVKNSIAYLNATYKYYKALGFDEVYMTIVPNPISVLCPERDKYNGLLPRVEKDSSLRMPMIRLYDIYRKSPTSVYYRSDTHWNDDGFTIWLNEFHGRLDGLVKEKDRK
jgi:hypothetical protein